MLYELKVLTPLLVPLVVNTPFLEREKDGMDPVLWMLVCLKKETPEAMTKQRFIDITFVMIYRPKTLTENMNQTLIL